MLQTPLELSRCYLCCVRMKEVERSAGVNANMVLMNDWQTE